jgi:hypothetical protein
MKAYGRHKKDCWCCPGHDKFPSESYNNRRSKHAHTRDTKIMHRAERRRQRLVIHTVEIQEN